MMNSNNKTNMNATINVLKFTTPDGIRRVAMDNLTLDGANAAILEVRTALEHLERTFPVFSLAP